MTKCLYCYVILTRGVCLYYRTSYHCISTLCYGVHSLYTSWFSYTAKYGEIFQAYCNFTITTLSAHNL